MDYGRLLVVASVIIVAASVAAGFMHVQTLVKHEGGRATKPPATKTETKTVATVVVTIRPGSFVEGTNPTFDPPTIKVMLGVNNTVRWVNMETEKISHDVAHEECFRNTPQC
ncbi:MAG: hypothetical protein NZ941_01840, partial [Candidatus Caldarchaeum sp.]|nr:hypothetical protein [Candidatus Caldarchaeum sp.]